MIRAVLALTVLGAGLRLAAAGQSLYGDELFTYAIVTQPGLDGVWGGIRATENTPPAFYVLAWLAGKASADPAVLRAPSLGAGVALIPLTAALAGRAFGPRAAVLAAALVAFSPFQVFYASELRAYAPMAACVAGATLALLRLLERDTGRRRAVLALLAAAAVWLHYVAVFPLAAGWLWALATRPDRRRGLVVAGAAATAAYLPWLPFLRANDLLFIIAALAPFEPANLVRDPLRTLAGHPSASLAVVPGALAGAALAAAAVPGAVAAAGRIRATGLARAARTPGALLVLGALAAPAGIAAYTAVSSGLFLPRNLMGSAPALAAVLAGILVAPRGRAVRLTGAGVAVAALAWGAARTVAPELRRPPYEQAAAHLDACARPQDPIVEEPLFPVDGPLRAALAINLERPHRLVRSDRADPAWAAGLRTGRVYVVEPEELAFGRTGRLTDPRFAPAGRVSFEGRIALRVTLYVPRRRAPTPSTSAAASACTASTTRAKPSRSSAPSSRSGSAAATASRPSTNARRSSPSRNRTPR